MWPFGPKKVEEQPPTPQNDSQYVYVIHAVETDFYKIGRTSNPTRRFAELNSTKGPYEYALLMAVPVSDSVKVERELHHNLRKKRGNGEWFKLNRKDLAQVLYDLEQYWKK